MNFSVDANGFEEEHSSHTLCMYTLMAAITATTWCGLFAIQLSCRSSTNLTGKQGSHVFEFTYTDGDYTVKNELL